MKIKTAIVAGGPLRVLSAVLTVGGKTCRVM